MNAKANILIDKDGRARLTDFGLTSIIGGNKSDTPQGPNPVVAMTWTVAGILNEGTVTNEVDVFVFAMVVAEVCTGEGESQWEFLNASTPNRHSRGIPLENNRPISLVPPPGILLNDRRRC